MILFRVITNTVQKLQVPPLMESSRCMQNSPEDLPHLLHYIKSNAVTGFDNVEDTDASNCLHQQIATASTIPSPDLTSVKGKEASSYQWNACSSAACLPKSSIQANDSLRLHSISISMPSSPAGLTLDGYERIYLGDKGGTNANHVNSNPAANPSISNIRQPKKTIFHSQPMPARGRFMDHSGQEQENSSNVRMNDNPYDSFKTWSRKFERKTSHLHAKQQEPAPEVDHSQNAEVEALPVDRYFDALEGPELDTLRASEELVLPEDKKWPFLLRFPISTFGICLGTSSQAILWKTLATSTSMSFLHVSPSINIFLWCISVSLTAIVSLIYSLKLIFYFEAVRREYCHPIRVNFFFAPWIAFLFLVLGVPSPLAEDLHASLWYLLMAPILCLELKIYGQWMSGGQRRLSKVANPSNHLSVIGNFVGALLGASMGLKEGPIFFFAVGLAHYLVLFVTLYQRLPTNETLPKELHPVFFLFVAAPSIASTAWARIQDGFDYGSKFAYFIALFLYFSLAVRVNFFWGFRFSLAWWAYTFPMTGASIATIKYSDSIRNPFTQTLSITLSTISALTVTALLISTLFHALVLRNLFPNDIAIAISERTPKENKKCLHPLSANSNKKDNESSTESICH